MRSLVARLRLGAAGLDAGTRRARLGAIMACLIVVVAYLSAFIYLGLTVPAGSSRDTDLYFDYGKRLLAGQTPYRDFVLEYPPLAAVLFAIPARFARDIVGFRQLFALQMLVVSLSAAVITAGALRRFALPGPHLAVLLIPPLWLVAAGRSIVFERFDLAPGVLTLLALVLFANRSDRLAWLVLGLGVALKLWPVIVAPLFTIVALQRRTPRQLLTDGGFFVVASIAPAAIVTRGDLSSMTTFFNYHLTRGLEIEALASSLLLPWQMFTGGALRWIPSHGSIEIAGSLARRLASLSLPLTGLALLATYTVAWRSHKETRDPAREFDWLVRFAMAVTLAFMLAGKVLSPQFLLWLVPTAALVRDRRAIVWTLITATLLLSQWLFPEHWKELLSFAPREVGLLLLRNLLLIALFAVLITSRFAVSRNPPRA